MAVFPAIMLLLIAYTYTTVTVEKASLIIGFYLALGTFMQVLDTTIANVSLPTIAGSLGVSPNHGTWVITSFAVANGISVPLTGWLMQRFDYPVSAAVIAAPFAGVHIVEATKQVYRALPARAGPPPFSITWR